MLQWVALPSAWLALATLTGLEIVLGVDNVVFLGILAGQLPAAERASGMRKALVLAVIPRVLLLLTIGAVIRLNQPLFTLPGVQVGISGQDLVFIGGGLFLIAKSVKEIHHKLEGGADESPKTSSKATSFGQIVGMVFVINIVFSLDSVITAVGMVDANKVGGVASAISIMVAAVLLSTVAMLGFAGTVVHFVERHPTIKMLALSFLILIGANLIGEGLHAEIPKGYTYFAMAFSLVVEALNIRSRKSDPVQLHEPQLPDGATD